MSENDNIELLVSEFDNEPEWMRISRVYENLRISTATLHVDIESYNKALRQLDGYGTSISNGKDRIFLMKEELARLESIKPLATPTAPTEGPQ